MNAWRRCRRVLHTSCMGVLSQRLRLGIVPRLVIAFIAVGALLLAAVFVAERSMSTERTIRITRTVTAPGALPKPAEVVRPEATDSMTPKVGAERRVISSDALLLARDRFAESVKERTRAKSPDSETNYQRAGEDLEQTAIVFTTMAASITGKSFEKLGSAVNVFRRVATELVKTSDTRRDAVHEYSTRLEELSTRVKKSPARSWHLFGRMEAGQASARLSADFEALRRQNVAFSSADYGDTVEMTSLSKAEEAVRKDLDDDQKSLRRADGGEWYDAVRADVASLSALRGAIAQSNEAFQGRQDDYSQQIARLKRLVPSRIERPQIIRAGATKPTAAAAIAALRSSPEAPVSPIVDTQSVVSEMPGARTRRLELASISAAVLMLLAYIAVSIVRPVRRLAERTRQLQVLAEHDPLTGLPNRRELFILLNAAIERALADGTQVGVFFLDIDNFKYVNDSMGHAFGDRVLISLAQRLQATTESFGFAARLGGDEFTVVFDQAQTNDDIRAAGMNIVQAFQKPLTVDNRDLIVSVSVGASIYPEHAKDAEALLKAADAALFRAKVMGRSQLSVFTPELLQAAAAKFTTEQGLRRAIERGEFELVFQPEISVETLETTLVEALIRWRMPDGSLTSPDQFLAIAEESGLIIEISNWVLQSAIEAAAHWHHGAWPEVRVSVNVTPRQLSDAGFVDRLRDLLRTHRLPSRCIEIELTESVLQTGAPTIDALKRLRAHGVAIALDDFGTGYSSFASLEQLPLTRIKLDRSLIAGIDNSPRSAAIAHAIIAMCQGLGLDITAEGIERPEQFAMLLKHRGMYLQGYLLARPTSRDELMPSMAQVAQRAHDLMLQSQLEKSSNVMDLMKPSLRVLSDGR
jgi:diguanylate cyclase (GGDEF)-like protein